MIKTIIPAYVMRPLRYYINVTLDGCRDHRAMLPDEDLHHATENLDRSDALLFGRLTYEMMEAAWRVVGSVVPLNTQALIPRPPFMDSFRIIDQSATMAVSSTVLEL